MSQDEKNRRLAAWVLGWRYWARFGFWWFGPKDEWEDLGEPVIEITEADCENYTPETKVNRDVPKPPDFYGDEAASALLLDHLKRPFPYFSICFNAERGKTEFEGSGLSTNRNFMWETPHVDRKTAICEAALMLMIEKGNVPA